MLSGITSSIASGIVRGMTIDQEIKVRENRLRRMASRRGYLLHKSRRRDPLATDYGTYVLVHDSRGNRQPGAQARISAFAKGQGMTLSEIEAELNSLTTGH